MNNIIFTQNNTPQSNNFGDIYYDIEDGLAEKHYVFIKGNNLISKFNQMNEDFNILELGFGTGLSFLLTALEFSKINSKFKLNFTSTELYPLNFADINKALSNWQDLYNTNIVTTFLEQYKNADLTKDIIINIDNIKLTILVGDVQKTLKNLDTKQDCFYFDGFSPTLNPIMWSEDVFMQIARLGKQNSSFSTYSASRIVKDIVTFAGFSYTKQKGFGKKRDMLIGIKK
jgi:tRNA 5-methylaminomethyl-2-thiouridine biosynthesis bifunctional protein